MKILNFINLCFVNFLLIIYIYIKIILILTFYKTNFFLIFQHFLYVLRRFWYLHLLTLYFIFEF